MRCQNFAHKLFPSLQFHSKRMISSEITSVVRIAVGCVCVLRSRTLVHMQFITELKSVHSRLHFYYDKMKWSVCDCMELLLWSTYPYVGLFLGRRTMSAVLAKMIISSMNLMSFLNVRGDQWNIVRHISCQCKAQRQRACEKSTHTTNTLIK